jgi:hypothetical protein
MPDDIEEIQRLVEKSNSIYRNNSNGSESKIQSLRSAQAAYKLATDNRSCSEITRNKIEFNLSFLSLINGDIEMAKEYLDCIKDSPLLTTKRKEVALLYTTLADKFKRSQMTKKSIDCYQSAAQLFSKMKDWLMYCKVELAQANLLSDLNNYDQSFAILKKIQMACLRTDALTENELVAIYCDISTIFAKDIDSHESAHHAMRLLCKALELIEVKESSVDIYIYQNIAAVWNQLGKYEKSLQVIKRLNDIFITDYNYTELNNKLLTLNEIKTNISKVDNNLSNGDLDSKFLSDVKYNEGYAQAQLKQFNEAINSFYLSHQFSIKSPNKNTWQSLEAIGSISAQMKDYNFADYSFRTALSICQKLNQKNEAKNILLKLKLIEHKKNIQKRTQNDQNDDSVSSKTFEAEEDELSGREIVNGKQKIKKKNSFLQTTLLNEEKKEEEESNTQSSVDLHEGSITEVSNLNLNSSSPKQQQKSRSNSIHSSNYKILQNDQIETTNSLNNSTIPTIALSEYTRVITEYENEDGIKHLTRRKASINGSTHTVTSESLDDEQKSSKSQKKVKQIKNEHLELYNTHNINNRYIDEQNITDRYDRIKQPVSGREPDNANNNNENENYSSRQS